MSTEFKAQNGQGRYDDMGTPNTDLARSDALMRTVVSSGNDALNLLFEAAHHHSSKEPHDSPANGSALAASSIQTTRQSIPNQRLQGASNALRLWSACRFVKMGWLSAADALHLLNAFYETLSPLSPILTDFYHKPENHHHLLTQEPLLCCTILCISSRYNILPSPGGSSRSYLIHERLWDYCERIILRIILGQERSATAKTRTLGTVEALLLWTEWHPRALHFPPAYDGWDVDLLLAPDEDELDEQPGEESDSRERWLEDVVNPAKRSDRMSWMLAGSALSLAHELAVFDDDQDEQAQGRMQKSAGWERVAEQRYRLRKLLYLYIEQLSFRLGCKTLITSSLARAVGPRQSPTTWVLRSPETWQAFIAAQIELTKTLKSAADVLFPSASTTKSLLQSGRYVAVIEHFSPLLTTFSDKYLRMNTLGSLYFDALAIEYHHARIYINSLGVQAIVERTLAEAPTNATSQPNNATNVDSTDFRFIQEVVDGGLAILNLAVKLSDTKTLLFSPVRVFLRIITASMLLLKGLSLGVSSSKLKISLDTLDRAIAALRAGALDDMHLGSKYAMLLDMHVSRLRNSFVPSAKPSDIQNLTFQSGIGATDQRDIVGGTTSQPSHDTAAQQNATDTFPDIDDWLTLPFDPSIVPFTAGDTQGLSWLGDGTMDFVWNLDT